MSIHSCQADSGDWGEQCPIHALLSKFVIEVETLAEEHKGLNAKKEQNEEKRIENANKGTTENPDEAVHVQEGMDVEE